MRGKRLAVLVVAVAGLVVPASAAAQATRTFVSGVGDDANPCSRTAPCKTFAGAISKTATGGEINVLDPGGFGAVTITKAITIIASPGVTAGVLVGGTNGITINTSGDSSPGDADRDIVTLEGLDIDGLGATISGAGLVGVSIQHAGTVRLVNDEIYGFADAGVSFMPSATTESKVLPPKLIVSGSSIHDNGQAGILAVPAAGQNASVLVENSEVENNACGLAIGLGVAATFSTSNCGVAATPVSGTAGAITAASSDSSISTNQNAGVLSDGNGAVNEISGDTVFGNGSGLSEQSGGVITEIGANSVFGNSGADGTATSIVTTGVSGPAGAAGAAGANGANGAAGAPGAAGKAGEIELVTCKAVTETVTKRVHGKKKKVKKTVQKCTGKLESGTVKFTSTGTVVKASLVRGSSVFASGEAVWSPTDKTARLIGGLTIGRKLAHGRYTLVVRSGTRVLERRSVTV
jgi:hypothetical protein